MANKTHDHEEPEKTRSRIAEREREEQSATTALISVEEEELEARSPEKIGEMLVDRGMISRYQLFNAMNESYRTGCPLIEACVSLGYLEGNQLEELLKGKK